MATDKVTVPPHGLLKLERGNGAGEVESDVPAKGSDSDSTRPPWNSINQAHLPESEHQRKHTQDPSTHKHSENYNQNKDNSGVSDSAARSINFDLPTSSNSAHQPHLFSARPVRNAVPNPTAAKELGPRRIAVMQDAYSELNDLLAQTSARKKGGNMSSSEASSLCTRLLKLGRALTERLNAVRYLGLAEPFEARYGSLSTACEALYKELASVASAEPSYLRPEDFDDKRFITETEKSPLTKSDARSADTEVTVKQILLTQLTDQQRSSHNVEGLATGGRDDVGRGSQDESVTVKAAVAKDMPRLQTKGFEHDLMKLELRKPASKVSSKTSRCSSLSSRRILEQAEIMALKARRKALAKVNEIRRRELDIKNEIQRRELDIKNDLECAELDAEIAAVEARAKFLNETGSKADSQLSSLAQLDPVTDLFLERDDDVAQDSVPLRSSSDLIDFSVHASNKSKHVIADNNTSALPSSLAPNSKMVTFDTKLQVPSSARNDDPFSPGQFQHDHAAGRRANVHGLRDSVVQSYPLSTKDAFILNSSTLLPPPSNQTVAFSLGADTSLSGPSVTSFVEPPNASRSVPLNVHSAIFQPRYTPETPSLVQYHQPCQSNNTANTTQYRSAPLSVHNFVGPSAEANLAKSIADAMSISRLPVPKPPVFNGDPLEYPAWSASFQHLVRNEAVTPEDKMLILRDYIAGPAKEAVGDLYFNLGEASYNSALEILKRRFGEDYTVSQAMKTKLDAWPDVRYKDTAGLRRYADYLRQCLVMSREISGLGVLNDPAQIKTLSHKLPDNLALSWGKKVAENKAKFGIYPSLDAFVSFLECQADALFEADLQAKSKRSHGGQTFTVALQKGDAEKPAQQVGQLKVKRCIFCEEDHYIQDCERFAKETFESRKSFALRKRLCFKCLRPGHSARGCVVKVQCKECKAKHVTVMHDPKFQPTSSTPEETPLKGSDIAHKSKSELEDTKVKAYMTARDAETRLYSLYMPVYISSASNPSKEELVYAMLDTMSDTSFLVDSVMDSLELETQDSTLTLTTLTSPRSTITCRKHSNLRVRGVDSDQVVHVPLVYSQSDIEVDKNQIPTRKIVSSIPHLSHLSTQFSTLYDAPVALLLGINAAEALKPLEVVSGEPGQPFALRTRLGWGLVGEVNLPRSAESEHAEPEACSKSSCELAAANSTKCFRTKDNTNGRLIELMERDFACPDESAISQEDHKFLAILSDGIKLNSKGHYEMPLPFRDGTPRLPNNRHIAMRRLEGLKQKFLKCPEHFKLYQEFVREMLDREDAEQVPQEDIKAGSVWYIPHHGVYNPNKPGKIRVVFDCAARCQNVSLNDCLLTGPDLMNSLVGVLCRFRLRSVAVSCDVEKMFHQFCVAPEHRDYLRFLWWPDHDLAAAPVDFRMRVHLFGAASSPGCANYGLKTLAKDHQNISAEASEFIQEDFYVDDGLASKDSVEEAVQLLKGARAICEKGSLHLHKIASNSAKVLSAFPESEVVKHSASLDEEKDNVVSIERALGVQWNLANDTLNFLHVAKETPTTKRGVLAAVASIFDPLGLVSPVILKGRQILQETCKLGMDWDDDLPPDLLSRWNSWISDVNSLSDIQIPRCYTLAAACPWTFVELHHFADASTKGYGECSYIRVVDNGGQAHSALVMAKSKVAPLRAVTVPRLELQAAVLAVRIARCLEKEFRHLHIQHHFWTDSRVVLGYIYNESKRFHIFVANRLQQIRDFSQPQQWHHVGTEQNPADFASRGLSVKSLRASFWQAGPEFLRQNQITYPQVNASVSEDDKEVKAFATVYVKATTGDIEEIVRRFSSLRRLLRVVWLIRRWRQLVKERKTRRTSNKAFTPDVRKEILHSVIRCVQRQHFPESSRASSHQLLPLNAWADRESLLRVGGRLSESAEDYTMKYPLILPQTSQLSLLLVRWCHERVHHSGRTLTIGALQTNGYWVCGARKVVDAVIHRCVPCAKRRGKPLEERMADLPPDRVEVAPPFMNTGLDCFGPFFVKEGRRTIKRYGLILTCLVSRAIHLEVIEDMSTDAFICGLRRFIALRGNVKLIRCDRGTNFTGAERELREARKEMNDAKIVEEMSERNCNFLFNPPLASRFGGVWERMIRIVRQILSDLIDNYRGRLSTDGLATLFHEVASIVNNRPLCPANLQDPSACEPLTPNHLLTLRPEPVFPPPGNFQREDMYARKRWRRIQFLASQFWARWKREYLPTLQPRKRWFLEKGAVKPGMLVLMVDEAVPRGTWKTARVEKVYPSSDGLVRSVQLRVCTAIPAVRERKGTSRKLAVQTSFLDRPIYKLVPLNIKID